VWKRHYRNTVPARVGARWVNDVSLVVTPGKSQTSPASTPTRGSQWFPVGSTLFGSGLLGSGLFVSLLVGSTLSSVPDFTSGVCYLSVLRESLS